jgi:hypothetical protein
LEPNVTYALLIYRTSPISEPIPELEERAALAGHRTLQAEAAAKRELRSVARLDDTSTARSVRQVAGTHEVTDGPFMETKEWLVGFYVIDCESMDQALERARLICPDACHAVEVRPITWQWKA